MTDAVSETDEALVEAIASAMWEYDNALFAHHNIAEMQSIAHAAIASLRAHDEARGMVLVPPAVETLRQAQNPKRVVMHIEHVGDAPTIYSDDGVDVYSVFEPTPEDLIYRFTHRPIPEELLDGNVSFSGDSSAAEARLHRAVYHMTGEPHLRAVPEQDAEAQENPDA